MEQSWAEEHAPVLSEAEERRDEVAQATGVLVAQFEISSSAAVEKLGTVASDSGRDVFEVARAIVENKGL